MTPAEFARMVNGLHAWRPDWPWHEIAAETQRMADYDFAAVSRACLAEALNPGAKWPSALGHLGVNPRAASTRRPSEEPTCSLHERLQPCGSCAADLLAATPDEVARRRAAVLMDMTQRRFSAAGAEQAEQHGPTHQGLG